MIYNGKNYGNIQNNEVLNRLIALDLWFTMEKIWYYGKNYCAMEKIWYYGKNYGTIVNYSTL